MSLKYNVSVIVTTILILKVLFVLGVPAVEDSTKAAIPLNQTTIPVVPERTSIELPKPTQPEPTKSAVDPLLDNCTIVDEHIKENNLAACFECISKTNNGSSCAFYQTSVKEPNLFCAKEGVGEQINFFINKESNEKLDGELTCRKKFDVSPTTAPVTIAPPGTQNTTTTEKSNSTSPTLAPGSSTVSPTSPKPEPTTPSTSKESTTTGPRPTTDNSGFSFSNFLGGIVFTLAVSSLAYVAFKFYKARTERNYHTL